MDNQSQIQKMICKLKTDINRDQLIETDEWIQQINKEDLQKQIKFKEFLKDQLKDTDELQILLNKLYDEKNLQIQTPVQLKRSEAFKLILLMYFNLVEREKLSHGGFYLVNMESPKKNFYNYRQSQEKIQCFLNYFESFYINYEKIHGEEIIYYRDQCSQTTLQQQLDLSEQNQQPIQFEFSTEKNESTPNSNIVDFADENICGLVLDPVNIAQEEVLMLICPEAIICMLFMPKMKNDESILITNLYKYNDYTGYESTFRCEINYNLNAKYNILAIDAKQFGGYENQLDNPNYNRELLKSFCGFKLAQTIQPDWHISTGKWGCGIFRGNKFLKTIIQLQAFALAQQIQKKHSNKIIFNTVGDMELMDFGSKLQQIGNITPRKLFELQKHLPYISRMGIQNEQTIASEILNYLKVNQQNIVNQGQCWDKQKKFALGVTFAAAAAFISGLLFNNKKKL